MEGEIMSEIILAVYVLTFLVGLPANLLALYAFSTKIYSKPSPTDILLLNLTVSDLLFLFCLPLKMREAASDLLWDLPDVLCSLTAFTFFSTIYTSSLLLTAVSVVRYVALAFPVAYQQWRRPLYAVSTCAAIWLISAAHCSIVFITQHVIPDPLHSNANTCYENFTEAQLDVLLPVRLEFSIVLCFIPLLVCVSCYLGSIRILYTRPRMSAVKKRKATGMALGTLVVFLICMLPYNFSHFLGFLQGSSPAWRHYTLLLSTFNTCLDPIIFYFSSPAFRSMSRNSFLKMVAQSRLMLKRGTRF